ncbi:hypothetical protein [Gellertiella hungarica]|uniref:Uncharacterized protein n=1 Tax=Gellertiella hungarica TaxID=1572859 RepID=A0A7W6NK37_9HYPH|nr:hypothetical protein [Gellertiella hungarica]MBB4064478.1 hypothetical protein [Gellertiella hungarica]
METAKDTFFKPTKISAEAKADKTNETARQILAAEVRAREKKTEALRALRLAAAPAEEPAPAPRKKAASAKRKTAR